ncbi:MAG: hypothetical protein J6V91_02935 [Kiritimatiellae bacterium]|nr:hypothetical protein [Kiritimatiellia bacterium]
MKTLVSIVATTGLAMTLMAGTFSKGTPSASLFLAGNNYLAKIAPDGTQVHRWRGGNNNDAWMLPNGHILIADGRAWEADEKGNCVWEYRSVDQTGGGCYSAQRLPDGSTLIGENSTGRIFEVTPTGEQRNIIQVPLNHGNRHQTLRMVRRLADGSTLVCRSGANIVERYAPGVYDRPVWTQKVPGLAFAAIADDQGNIYISSLNQVQKWSPNNQLLWELKASETGLPIRNMTGLHLLPNGNLIVGCYGYGNGVGAFEVTPAKEILWTYRSGEPCNDSHMAVQCLDESIQTPIR